MIRTQIQLTEEQAQSLKELAGQENVSMAELIRQAVDYWLQSVKPVSRSEQRRRAIEIVGQFRSGQADISERHDEYLVEAYS
jgi:metal-responsive CopG/Arc/MetJ family transcriptional regulator